MSATPATRACCRCGRAFAGKAGRMAGGKPMCPSCANATRKPVACSACGRATKRPGRLPGDDALVCEPCLRRETHATCRACRRHRKVAGRDAEGRPVCAGCAQDAPAMRTCRACARTVLGRGEALCDDCSLARRVKEAVAAGAEGLPQGWARALFEGFCASPELIKARRDMHKHVEGYAVFFRSLGEAFPSSADLTQAQLLGRYGAEGLRRQFQAVGFLARRLGLAWDADVAEATVEGARVDATLARTSGQPWAGDLAAYRRSLAEGEPVAPRTARMYVASAADLLARSGVGRATELTQRNVKGHLLRRPGQAANLARFLGWVAGNGGRDLANRPRRPGRRRIREKAVLRRSAALLRELAVATDPREGRALLAAAISVVHGVPLSHVLALRTSVARIGKDAVRLWRSGKEVMLTGSLADGFARLAARSGAYAFPGRNAAQPLSTAAVEHQVEALGLPSMAGQLRRRVRNQPAGQA